MSLVKTIQVQRHSFQIDLSEWEEVHLSGDSTQHFRSFIVDGLFMQFSEVSPGKNALEYLHDVRQYAVENKPDFIEVSEIETEGVFYYYLIVNDHPKSPGVSLISTVDIKEQTFPVITLMHMNSDSTDEVGDAFIRFAGAQF